MSLKDKTDEPDSNVPIKEEANCRMEEFRAPDIGFQEFANEMEPPTTRREHSHNHAEAYAEEYLNRNSQTGHKNARKRNAGPRKPRIVWSEEAENTLISLWRERTGGLRNVRRDINFCQRLAKELEKSGHQRSALEVKIKMHNLQGKYSDEKRKMGSSTWVHYEKVHAILGKDDHLMEESTVGMPYNASERNPVIAIKKEPADLCPPSMEFHEFAVKVEPLQSSQSEIEQSGTAPVAYAPHHDPLIPQTLNCLKAELILDDELPVSACPQAHNQDIREAGAHRQAGVNTAEDDSTSYERSPRRYPEVLIKTQQSQTHSGATHKCEFCQRSFTSTEYLTKHLLTHTTVQNGVFTCQCCGRSFSSKGNLAKHMKTHAGDTHNCEVCGKQYTQNHNLKKHMLQKHPEHKNLFISSLQTSRDPSGHCEDNRQYTSGSQTSYEASVNSEENVQYISGVDSNFDVSVTCENTQQSTSAPTNSTDAAVQSGSYLHSTSGPATSRDASVHPEDKFQHNANPHISPDASRHSEHKPLYTSELPTSCEGAAHSESTHQSTSGTVTSNEPSVHTKKELLWDEEFLDDGVVAESDQRSQQSALVSTLVQSVSFEVSQNVNPKEILSTIMGVPHCNKTYKCDLCPKTFKTTRYLNQHITAHAEDRRREFACKTCGKTFSAALRLYNHRRVHTGRRYKVVYCQVCGLAFKNNTQRKEHMLRRHEAEMRKIVPKPRTPNAESVQTKTELASDEEFIEEDEGTRSAQENQLSMPEDSVSCELCHNIYPQELFSTHMRLAHRTWKCEMCSRVFLQKSWFLRHLRTHDKDRKREFACLLCGSAFYTKGTLVTHMQIHSEGIHTCEVCGAEFTQLRNLKAHMLRQHMIDTKELTVETQGGTVHQRTDGDLLGEAETACAQGSDQSAVGLTDEEQVTSVEPKETCEISYKINPKKSRQPCEPTYKCQLCSKSFKTTRYLKQHMNTHAKDRKRKYACQTCGKTFSASSSLYHHRTKVHGAAKYDCQLCGAAFIFNSCLKEHMLRRHLAEVQHSVPNSLSDSLQTKPELTSDETLEEENVVESAQGYQQTTRTSFSLAEDRVTCEPCHKSYPKELFSTHMRLAHQQRQSWKCEFCLRVFTHKLSLRRHITTHDKNRRRRYSCSSCGRAFYNKTDLSKHVRRHAKDRKRKFACQTCGSSFFTNGSLTSHMQIHSDKIHKCEVCGAEFTLMRYLKEHKLRHQLGEAQPESQTANDASVQTKTELAAHEEFLVKDEDAVSAQRSQQRAEEPIGTYPRLPQRTWKCALCTQIFTQKCWFMRHLRTHDKNRKREFPCLKCGSAFYTKGTLAVHMQTHSDETHKCEVCGGEYSQLRNLKAHMLRQHMDDEKPVTSAEPNEACELSNNSHTQESQRPCERKYKCELCPRVFTSKIWFTRHQSTHENDRSRQFACQSCGSVFGSKGNLTLHMQTHLAETATACTPESKKSMRELADKHDGVSPSAKPKETDQLSRNINPKRSFMCDLCPHSFTDEDSLRRHTVTHAKDRSPVFTCQSCGRVFSSKGNLVKHVKTHTGETHNCEVCGKQYTQNHNLKKHMLHKHPEHKNLFIPDSETSHDASRRSEDKHHLNTGSLTSHDGFEYSDNNLQDLAGPAISYDGTRYSENTHQSTNPQTSYVASRLSEVNLPNTSGPLASDEVSVHTKIQLLSDEELMGDFNLHQINEICEPSHNIHPNESQTVEDAKFKCEFCPRSFQRPENLKRHMCTHSKDNKRQFACTLCESAFGSKRQLSLHMKFHSGNTYNCEVCGHRFTQQYNLKMHLLSCQQLQQYDPGSDTSNDASVHPKAELMSDEECLGQDKAT